MKIFGFEISRPTQTPQGDRTGPTKLSNASPPPVEKLEGPASTPTALIPSVKNPSLTYTLLRGAGRGVFNSAEYDLGQIGRIEDTDGYVRQAFGKKVGLMFKEGYDFVGSNKNTVRYIKIRLAQIARASNVPTNELMRYIGIGLVKKSNAFLIKVRSEKASGGKTRTTADGKTLKPVAGYFIAPPESMTVDADENGKIRGWRQRMPTGYFVDFRAEDVVHFHFDKKEGFSFGTPVITPVVDDIRALRKIEENIELLVYQYLFPLFHYIVGTETAPAHITETGEHEVDVVRREIQFMPSEGGIVTPERHEIKMIGAEGRALHAEAYVEHFKKRVFSGLGVSAVDMGEGETANRATANTMSRALTDSVKDIQAVIETQFNHFVVSELLLESTFGKDVLEEENIVKLRFHEIDIDKRMLVEKHASEMFVANLSTHGEARAEMGKEPLLLPEHGDPHGGEDLVEWNQLHWKLFEEPKALISAVDEPFSPGAQALGQNPSSTVSPENVKTAGEQHVAAEVKKIKARPKTVTRSSVNDSLLNQMYQDLEQNIVFNFHKRAIYDHEYINSLINTQSIEMTRKLLFKSNSSFIQGYMNNSLTGIPEAKALSARRDFEARAHKYVTRLLKQVSSTLTRNIDSKEATDKISVIRSVFSSFEHRVKLISDVEVRRAYNYGVALALQNKGYSHLTFTHEGDCSRCLEGTSKEVRIDSLDLEDLPPFHGNCGCGIAPIRKEE